MAVVVLDKLTKIYDRGHAPAADAVSLEIADGEFMVLLGPSGCGKTTTLRMVAGLESISSGTLTIDGRTMNGVPAKDRDIAMVFQSYALYPHMTVKDNLAFGLKRRGFARTEIERRVTAAAASLGLSELLGRRPHALSGGQRQRVALGRAIVRDPKVFLFDEPLSNLDAGLRATTRGEIAQLHRRLGATMIYVTHDQIEAMTLGTRICIMNGGRIEQVGQPLEVYRRPESTFVAGFLGNPPMNLLPASATGEDDGRTLAIGDQRITLPASVCPQSAAGRRIVFGIRPEHIRAEPQPATATGLPTIRAKAVRVEPLGAETIVAAEIPGIAKQLLVRLPGDAVVHASTTMTFVIDAANSHLFDEDGRVMRT